MRRMKCLVWSIGLTVAVCMFNSCAKDDGYSLDNAWYSIATIRTSGYGATSYWLTLDSGASLWPVATNVPWYNLQDKQRAVILYTILSDEFNGYDHAVKILDIDGILTKQIAENLGDNNDETYGTDPVGITSQSNIWIGDGFLNIIFEFFYGGDTVHFINLIENSQGDTPYCYEFRHNAFNDAEHSKRKGIVAFDLSTVDTKGEEVELTIQVPTFDGMKDFSIKYDSSKNPAVLHRNDTLEDFAEIK